MEYVFFAGANGSGKSTLIKNLRSLDEYQGFRYICADEIESKPELANFEKIDRMKMASFLAKEYRETSLQAGQDLIYESVASHPSHLQDLDRIKGMGYKITTVYVTTESPEINLERIAKRGRDNDTYLTPERVKRRYERSLDLLSEFIKRSDKVIAYDNSINYLAVFYKTPEEKNYLIGEKEWADRYIVDKLQKEGIRVFTAKDLDKATYVKLLQDANRLIEPPVKEQVQQVGQARQAEQVQEKNTKEKLSEKDEELISRIRKSPKGAEFDKLFTGREKGEQAETRLLHLLAFFTDQNPEQMARIYKASELYDPAKGENYLNGIISKSLTPYNQKQSGNECVRSRLHVKPNDRGNTK